MPLYEYRCSKCQGITEVQAHADDAPPFGCSQCGQIGAPLHKILSRVAPGRRSSEVHSTEEEHYVQETKPKHTCGGGCSH